MAKAPKKALPSKTPVENAPTPGVKAKRGVTTRGEIDRAVDQLRLATAKLSALSAAMESNEFEEVEMLGPKGLARGVDDIWNYAVALDGAIQKLSRSR